MQNEKAQVTESTISSDLKTNTCTFIINLFFIYLLACGSIINVKNKINYFAVRTLFLNVINKQNEERDRKFAAVSLQFFFHLLQFHQFAAIHHIKLESVRIHLVVISIRQCSTHLSSN